MSKILEKEFRNELYKNLMDAGYSKDEAQKIVGGKYFVALKESLIGIFNGAIESISADTFDVVLNNDDINGMLEELRKLKKILS